MKFADIAARLPRREREQARRKGEIIDAAEKLFFSRGIEQTSIDEIAEAAEFSKTTLYKYFMSKEDLFAAVVLRGLHTLAGLIESGISQNVSGFENVKSVIRAHAKFHREHPDYACLFGRYIFSGTAVSEDFPEDSYRKKCMHKLRDIYELFNSVLEQGRKDGSINPDFVSPASVVSLGTAINGVLMLTMQLEPLYIAEFKVSYEDVMQNYLDNSLAAMKPN